MASLTSSRRRTGIRYAILGAGISAAWLTISLFSGAQSASADERDGGGLLGAVGSLLGGVSATTGAVGDTLGAVVGTAVEPVNSVLEPVVAAVPAPVAPVVELVPPVVDGTTDTVDTVVETVDTAVVGTVGEATQALTEVASGGTVGRILDPVVGTVDRVVGGVPVLGPVVGGLLGDSGVSGVVTPVTGAVDGLLGGLIGSTGELPGGVLPEIPGIPLLPGDGSAGGSEGQEPSLPVSPPAIGESRGPEPPGTGATGLTFAATSGAHHGLDSPPPGVGDAAAQAGLVRTVAPQGGTGGPAGAPLPSGGPTAGAGSSAGVLGSDLVGASQLLDAMVTQALTSVDDALPSSPVFGTDTTPD
ncbi:hypothetical protein [Agromyces aureus]|uniref:Uncharacterized protein n=1 Tax=Agromyces aureus TaxID=453304 RepID=A0A191WIV0_9MICO|nr:hypothetical protein [Agromyces aureus]ANJ28245.1 hypothetical protein ATC03_17595 [Agromyces aureus]